EILSVATYALTAYLRRGPRPAEAGFKYFILGAFSSAVLLYGASLLYGVTHSTTLSVMANELQKIFGDSVLEDRRALAYFGLALIGWGWASRSPRSPSTCGPPTSTRGRPPR